MSSDDFLRDYEVRFLPNAKRYAPKGRFTIPYRPTINAHFTDFGSPPPPAEFFVSDVSDGVVWVGLREL